MKKNAMLKIAAVLLVAVLLTTCAISSTFAKYASEIKKDGVSARVAKWGITVTTTAEGFSDTYELNSSDVMVKAAAPVTAPGTAGVLTFTSNVVGVNDTEVALLVDYEWEVKVGSAFNTYDPIMFHVTTTSKNLDSIDWANVDKVTLKGLQTKLTATLDDDEIAATETENVEKTVYIYWAWNYEGDDAKDTTLGKAASGDTTNFSISLSTQVVQDGEDYAK